MLKQNLTIIILTLFFLSSYDSLTNAGEMLLCMSSTDEYVVAVDQEGGCLEEESPVKISGSNVDDLKNFTPIAIFEEYNDCETVGTVAKIGFDKNGNSKLDEEEVMSTTKNCAVKNEEESD